MQERGIGYVVAGQNREGSEGSSTPADQPCNDPTAGPSMNPRAKRQLLHDMVTRLLLLVWRLFGSSHSSRKR